MVDDPRGGFAGVEKLNIGELLARVLWHLAHTPPSRWRELARLNAVRLSDRLPEIVFNRLHAVDTGGILDRGEILGDDARFADVTCYEPTHPRHFRALMRRLAVAPREHVFVDVGCGKGRVLLLAARRPFRAVIGIELSPHLAAVARRNLQTYRGPLRCRDVRILEADVRGFVWPEDPLVVHCYNPFTGALFDAFLERLLRARDGRGAPLHLLYGNPVEHERVLATGRFACTAFGSTPGPVDSPWNRRYALYRLLPVAASPGADGAGISPGLR